MEACDTIVELSSASPAESGAVSSFHRYFSEHT